MTLVERISFLLEKDMSTFWALYKKNREKLWKKREESVRKYRDATVKLLRGK